MGKAHPPAAGQARQRACSGAGAYGPGPGTPPPPTDAPADAAAAGRRRFAGPKGPQNQSMGGGQGPPPMLCARCARPPPRPGRWDFPPAKRSIRHPFSPWLPANKTSGPLPMSGPPAYFVRNQKNLPANFPPLFQKRQGGRAERRQWRKKRGGSPVSKGVEGCRLGGDAQRPLRTARGAEPPTESRGSAPGGAPATNPVS